METKFIKFGRTGYEVVRLGFGAMRLPTLKDGSVNFELSTPLIKYAIEHGINFIDSHHFYHNSQSETAVGKAIEGVSRDKIILQTKIGIYSNYSENQCRDLLEKALKKMRTSYIDFYLSHSLSWKDYLKYNNLFVKFTNKLINEGLVRYRGFSSHDTPENIKKLIETDEFSCLTLQYNLLNLNNEDVISLAHEKGMGVVVMGPVGGGTLASPGERITQKARNTAHLALKFVLHNSNVHIALSGMSTIEQVKENLATLREPGDLKPDEVKSITDILEERKGLMELYCTGCQYCLPCPNKIKIPDILKFYNLARIFKMHKLAKGAYDTLKLEERADMCKECGECETKCPQRIPIQKKLKEIAEYFTSL